MLLPIPRVDLLPIIEQALREDLGSGDLTCEACVPEGATASAQFVARAEVVACGGFVAALVFQTLDPSIEFESVVAEGAQVEAKTTLWRVRGRARTLLMGERVALNLTQRMTGIATLTQRYVRALAPGSTTRITDTRKTTPGLRVLERYAVRVGGGHNHRDNLGSAVMIKDNHIIAAGGITAAVRAAKARSPHTSRIECEVTNLAEFAEAKQAGADIIMLDNMSDALVAEAVTAREGRCLEASGGITLERIASLSRIGVDVISVGALTHSAPAADIGLDFDS
jgi:nicotinate-nucleotide pyrophosphorylase (carboxylating)